MQAQMKVQQVEPGGFVCRVGTEVVGRMLVAGDGEIQWIVVDKQYRRRGYARAMWLYAQDCGIEIKHSPHRTPEGELWARSVGGQLPTVDDYDCYILS